MKKLALTVTSICTAAVVTVSAVIGASSYFNNKELHSLTTQCYEANGEPIITIHHKLTNDYSFSCNLQQR